MKFTRLTKEQLDELHQEFINFLAAQSITNSEWEDLKKNKPEVAEEEIDIFSDLIWQGVLKNVIYLEHIAANQLHLFYFTNDLMYLIALKIKRDDVDITTAEGYDWLQSNLLTDEVEIYNSKKSYGDDKTMDKFELIYKGAVITKGGLYQYFDKLIN